MSVSVSWQGGFCTNKSRVIQRTVTDCDVTLHTKTFILLRTPHLNQKTFLYMYTFSIACNSSIYPIKFPQAMTKSLLIHCELFYIL